MKKKGRYLLALMIFNSSCFLYVVNQQSISERLTKHENEISKNDVAKIDFTNIYLAMTKDPQNSNNYNYDYLKFYQDGRVYLSKNFPGKKPSKQEVQNPSGGHWSIYIITSDNIYIEEFNGYAGYFFTKGKFDENNKKIIFSAVTNLDGELLHAEPPEIYSLDIQ